MWWKAGSRYETAGNNGISHFIEHMLFKGTTGRSAYDIAREIDAIGGSINAFTGREYTCLYARVLRKDLSCALDVISDMYLDSLFDGEEIEKERYVIGQEIKMIEDSPEEYIYDMFNASYYKEHALGMPILGTEKTVEGLSGDQLRTYFRDSYGPENTIITITGRVDHDRCVESIKRRFSGISRSGFERETLAAPRAPEPADGADDLRLVRTRVFPMTRIGNLIVEVMPAVRVWTEGWNHDVPPSWLRRVVHQRLRQRHKVRGTRKPVLRAGSIDGILVPP